MSTRFPVIDPVATGENIVRLRNERGLSVRDLQEYFGFEEPRAIYKWQRGQTLPSVDNLFALGAILQVPMDEIIVSTEPQLHILAAERQAEACRSALFIDCFRYDRRTRTHPLLLVSIVLYLHFASLSWNCRFQSWFSLRIFRTSSFLQRQLMDCHGKLVELVVVRGLWKLGVLRVLVALCLLYLQQVVELLTDKAVLC